MMKLLIILALVLLIHGRAAGGDSAEIVVEPPAMKDENTPVAGQVARSFGWRKREPEMPSMSIVVQYTQDERGDTANCKVIKLEGDLPERMRRDFEHNMENGKGCPIGRGGRGVPYRDENGVPVARQVTVTFDVKVEEPDE